MCNFCFRMGVFLHMFWVFSLVQTVWKAWWAHHYPGSPAEGGKIEVKQHESLDSWCHGPKLMVFSSIPFNIWDWWLSLKGLADCVVSSIKGYFMVEVGGLTHVYLVVVSNMFSFHPHLGKWSNLTDSFQLGRNHQLVIICDTFPHRNPFHQGFPCKGRTNERFTTFYSVNTQKLYFPNNDVPCVVVR